MAAFPVIVDEEFNMVSWKIATLIVYFDRDKDNASKPCWTEAHLNCSD